jgi:sodium transport system permease protein
VRVLYLRELRAALREKAIVINSILIPTFLYPFLLWVALTGIMFTAGQTDKVPSRLVVRSWPEARIKFQRALQNDKRFQWVDSDQPIAALEERVRLGQLDALVELLPATNTAAALPGNFAARITYSQSQERSAAARERILGQLDDFREKWVKRESRKLGLEAPALQGFTVSSRNVASTRQMGAFVLGLVAPIIFVVMVAVGTFYPAIDAIAGERERNTWETLMSSAASRVSIVTAKYLYVVTLGGLAGLLNLTVVLLTLKPVFAPLLAQAGKTIDCTIPLAALPVAVASSLLLAGFVAAGMMLLACFARTFKEGQAMISPFYLAVMVPVMFLQAPGLKFSIALAFIPVVNVTLVVREALSGVFHWPQMAISLAVSLAAVALLIRAAAYVLQFEDVVMGSYGGGFKRFFQQRVLKRPTEVKS